MLGLRETEDGSEQSEPKGGAHDLARILVSGRGKIAGYVRRRSRRASASTAGPDRGGAARERRCHPRVRAGPHSLVGAFGGFHDTTIATSLPSWSGACVAAICPHCGVCPPVPHKPDCPYGDPLPPPPPPGPLGDGPCDGGGVLDIPDLAVMLGAFGESQDSPTPGLPPPPKDVPDEEVPPATPPPTHQPTTPPPPEDRFEGFDKLRKMREAGRQNPSMLHWRRSARRRRIGCRLAIVAEEDSCTGGRQPGTFDSTSLLWIPASAIEPSRIHRREAVPEREGVEVDRHRLRPAVTIEAHFLIDVFLTIGECD